MAAMKITLSGAMRARDVSRPRPEHLAEAAERENTVVPRVHPLPASGKDTDAAEPESRNRRRRRRFR
jgi:hypothetical protein